MQMILEDESAARQQPALSGTDRHRQHGEGSVAPKGTIVAPKKGDSFWWIASAFLLVGVVTSPLWLPAFAR